MKNYIVTGGLGHIGSHVVDALIARGDNVLIIDNLLTGKMENRNPKADLINSSVLDIANDPKILEKKWDGIFHLAVFMNLKITNDDPIKAEENGSNLTLALLELCRVQNIPKMVFTSSIAVEYNPTIPYSIEKKAGEEYCNYFKEKFGISTSIIRLQGIYGSPRHLPESGNVIPVFLEQKKKQGKIVIWGDGSQIRDFVYYTDVVDAILEAENKEGLSEVGTCKGHSILEVAKYFNCPIEFEDGKKWDVAYQVSKKSDYKTTISLEEGMKLLLNQSI